MNEETLFQLALEQPVAERAAFLDKMCGDDELRQRVAALLHAAEHTGDFLGQPPIPLGATVDSPPPAAGPGSRVGPYKLLQQIGEGGMGTVFMAEQTEPVRRRVALKLIKAGMDTRQVIARFEAERQALALMDHPNIAKVLDGGATDAGRPYFVMELVKGVPITKYCDEHRLTPKQRLELFVPVCQAVQHAHQKGIIHRDLKPSNVLIALYDGKPVPKVIDFGVAKAIGGGLTEKTLFTDFGAVVGTLEYMSPEQAELNQIDIDTRSDVYALGVMLYELLTGTTPLERKRLRSAAMLECLRIIREEEPPRPSTRLSTTEELPSIASNRGLEPRKLSGLMRGDLDWIVMKCLEKDRNRRYETANGLSLDVQRYLADEPVLACPPSALYRLRKFARRRKALLRTAAVVAVVVLLAAGGVGWAVWDRAEQQTAARTERAGRLVETERAVSVALAKAEQLAEQAEGKSAGTSREAEGVLAVWDQAAGAVAEAAASLRTGVDEERLRQRVEDARWRLEQGRGRAQMRHAHVLRQEKLLRDLDEARLQRATVARNNFDVAGAAAKYEAAFAAYGLEVRPGTTDVLARRIRAEERVMRDALLEALAGWTYAAMVAKTEPSRQVLDALATAADDDPWRRRYRAGIATHYDRPMLRNLAADARQQLPAASSVDLLAVSLFDAGDHEDALALLRWARGRYPTDFWIHFDLGAFLAKERGRARPADQEEAAGCFRAALALRPDTALAHFNLGVVLRSRNRLDDAVAENERAIALDPKFAAAHSSLGLDLAAKKQWEASLAEHHKAIELNPNDPDSHGHLAATLADMKQWDDAIAEYRKALELDPKFAAARVNLGLALVANNRRDEAILEYRKAIKLDPDDARAYVNLGLALAVNSQWDDAITAYQQAIERDSGLAQAYAGLGHARVAKRQWDDAIWAFHKALDLEPELGLTHAGLGVALAGKGQRDDAIAEFRKAITADPKDIKAHYNLANSLAAKGQEDDAMAEYRKAIDIDPKFAPAHTALGIALARRNHLDEAIAEHQKVVELTPRDAAAHANFGVALLGKERWDDAIAEFQKSIDLDANNPNAHAALGQAQLLSGRFAPAKTSTQRALDLLPDKHPLRSVVLGQLQQCNALIALEARLLDVLAGKIQPATNDERLGLIEVCRRQRRQAAAAKLYTDAFVADPKLADNLQAGHRFSAARAAALAGTGGGTDAAKLDDAERTRLRKQALDWLRADLDRAAERREDAALVQTRLRRWQEDTNLAGVHDKDALAKLATDEQEAWRKFWADVAEMMKKAGDPK